MHADAPGMSQPAPQPFVDPSGAPAPQQPLAPAPAFAPALAAPPAPAVVPMPPSSPAQALDMGVPLQHSFAAPAAPVEPAPAAPPVAPAAAPESAFAHPAAPAAPPEPAFVHPAAPPAELPADAWPASPAVPTAAAMPAPVTASPAGFEPAAIPEAEPAAPADASTAWWAIGNALLLAVAALAWQLISFYAREQLPAVESSGAPLTRFDQIVGSLPLAGSSVGMVPGVVLALGALGLVAYGSRQGYRDPLLQGVVAGLALLSLALVALLPVIAG